jgi:outer membrane receptor protein involved in Fe transport
VNFQTRLKSAAAPIALSVMLAAQPALAQETDETAAEAAADQDASGSDEVIVVTGSRIARPEFSLPNPVVTLGGEAIEQSGETNLTEFLVDQPALIGSQTSTLSAGSNLVDAQQVGSNFLDLRNLGENRTLVLVDGRRHVAGYPGTAAVDINTIPTDLVERIDVLTGGASAIYGADGVSGVVNFILKRDFEGLRVRGQAGISQRGDAGSRLISVVGGQNFADDRANITLSYEFNEQDRFKQTDRLNYGRTGPSYGFVRNPDDGTPGSDNDDPNVPDRILLTDIRWADTSFGGAVDLDGDFAPDFTGEGDVYDPGSYVPGGYTIGGSSTPREIYYGDYLPYTRRHIANALLSYEFSPALQVYAEGKYVRSTAYTFAQPTYDFSTALFEDNYFLNQRFGSAVVGDAAVSRDNFDFGIRRYELERELFRTVIGAEGELSPHLNYNVSYVFGQSTQESTNRNDRISDRYYAALDAVVDPATGNVTCRINLPGQTGIQWFNYNGSPYQSLSDTSAEYPYVGPVRSFTPGECVPLNILGHGAPSQEALDWVTVDHSDWARLRQHVVTAYLSGDSGGFFELPGGPIGFALGAEYRKESSHYIPSEYSLAGMIDDNAPARVDRGSFDVKEAFGEINLPILANVPFAETLSVGGALRISDYSTIGTTTTWNVNGIYAPIPDISFHGTYSVAVRAPNITELFAGGSGTYEFIIDPCGIDRIDEGTQYREANCTTALTGLGIDPSAFDPGSSPFSPQLSSLLGFQGGNPELDEEEATTWTVSTVLRPRFVPGLTVRADWYDVELANAIQYSTAQDVVDLCYDQPTLDNIYCDVIDRSGTTGFISDYTIIPQNVASFETAGLDVTVNYTFTPGDLGRFNVRLVGGYLDQLEFVPSVGADPENELYSSLYPAPRYSAVFDLTWEKGPLTVNYGINWHGKTRRVTREQEAANPDYLPSEYIWYREKWEHEVFVGYDVDERFEIYGGVNNLFDRKPDVGATGYPISAVGRSFYVGIKTSVF